MVATRVCNSYELIKKIIMNIKMKQQILERYNLNDAEFLLVS